MVHDNHARYSIIGFTVIIGVVAIIATLVYLGGFHDRDSEFLVETYYDNPVSGLSVGSPVNLRGVKVGEVREISFAMSTYWNAGATIHADVQRVVIVMALRKDMLGIDKDGSYAQILPKLIQQRVAAGLRATVASSGITGLSRIELNVVENAQAPETLGWTPRYPLIPPSPSLFDSFTVAATKFMNRLKTMDFASVWSNVNRTANSAARTAENMDAIVESQRAGIAAIVQNVEEVSESLKALSEDLRQNPSLILRAQDPQPLRETAR